MSKTAQQWFDYVVKRLLKQGVQSYGIIPNGVSYIEGCLYRGPNNTRCAVGWAIPNRLYSKSMEVRSIQSIIDTNPSLYKHIKLSDKDRYNTINFWLALQLIHDKYSVEHWPLNFKKFTEKWGLEYKF